MHNGASVAALFSLSTLFPQRMSRAATPVSSILLNAPRVAVEATINSDKPGLKTWLVEFFSGAKLFAKIERTGIGITFITIQGFKAHLTACLERLAKLLKLLYDAAIVWGDMTEVPEDSKFTAITIEETPLTRKRNQSSGEFLEQELEEISFGGSAATETVKKIARNTFNSMINYSTGIAAAKGLMAPVKEKHIYVKNGEQTFVLEVSKISSLPDLIQKLDQLFSLPGPIKLLYCMLEENPVLVPDIDALRDGVLYYVLAGFEELPKKGPTTKQTPTFSLEMKEFFERLEARLENPAKRERQMRQVREAFDLQDIEYQDLVATGELAMTDEKLKEYGIAQGGLRTAILAVIKSIQ